MAGSLELKLFLSFNDGANLEVIDFLTAKGVFGVGLAWLMVGLGEIAIVLFNVFWIDGVLSLLKMELKVLLGFILDPNIVCAGVLFSVLYLGAS